MSKAQATSFETNFSKEKEIVIGNLASASNTIGEIESYIAKEKIDIKIKRIKNAIFFKGKNIYGSPAIVYVNKAGVHVTSFTQTTPVATVSLEFSWQNLIDQIQKLVRYA